MTIYECDQCQDLFEDPVKVDEGIGDYEYWGARGRDVQIVEVSPCCHESYTELDTEDERYIALYRAYIKSIVEAQR